MKILLRSILMLFVILSIANCSRDDNPIKTENSSKPEEKKPLVLKEFYLEKNNIEIDLQKSRESKIKIHGNGKYTVSAPDKIAKGSISSDKHFLVITGLSKGITTVAITDEWRKETLNVEVKVIPANIPHEKKLENYHLSNKTIVELRKIGMDVIKKYEANLKEINALPKLSERYKEQAYLWESTRELYNINKKDFIEYKGNDVKQFSHIFNNIHIYGYGYSIEELMARRAQQYAKEYPSIRKQIEEKMSQIFKGLYSSQEGSNFISGLNDEDISGFNKIIDIVNKEARK